MRSFKAAIILTTLTAIAMQPALSATRTTAQALSSIDWVVGTWHCTDGKSTETDVYTRKGEFSILDLDSNNGVTLITFDAKRQKWVVMEASSDGYGVAEGVANAGDPNKKTFFGAYPHVGKRPFIVYQTSHSHFTLGGSMSCTRA